MRNMRLTLSLLMTAVLTAPSSIADQSPSTKEDSNNVTRGGDGTVQIEQLEVPLSAYMSPEAKRAFLAESHSPTGIDRSSVAQFRRTLDEHFFAPLLERARKRYAVEVRETTIDGVRASVVTPANGVGETNRHRVLINLHGGGFVVGGGLGGLVESTPIASVGKIKIVTIEYRQGPEYAFPAASEDVAVVYRALLKVYRPESIGIYGCSAGGLLAAQSIAWFQAHNLPRPGAIGVFCAAAGPLEDGDSSYLSLALNGFPGARPKSLTMDLALDPKKGYFASSDPRDPLVSPVLSPNVLAKFPPTLLITGTRAGEMSAACNTQVALVRAGAVAELHVWDGMWHAFFYDVDLPESREAFDVVVRFFETRLQSP